MKEYKIAILGNEDVIIGFKGLGVDTFGLNEGDAEDVLKGVMDENNYAVVFITEDWILKLDNILDEYKGRALPAVVAVPTPQGTSGAALQSLKKTVEQAVGSDILFS